MYKCLKCSFETENKMKFISHGRLHSNKEHECICGYKTKNLQAYSSHCGKCRTKHPDISFDYLKGRKFKIGTCWNKGLTKYNDQRLAKLSETMKNSESVRSHCLEMTKNKSRESYIKQSETRISKFKNGELKPPVRAGRGKYSYIKYNEKEIMLRSTYEFIYALYLIMRGIEFEYEMVRVDNITEYSGCKTFLSDFKIGNKIIEIKGFYSSKVDYAKKSFEFAGYDYEVKYWNDLEPCYKFLKDHIDIDSIIDKIWKGHECKTYYVHEM